MTEHPFKHSRTIMISDVKLGNDAVEKGLIKLYPFCKTHGAMNEVTGTGLYRCLMCHVGVQVTELD